MINYNNLITLCRKCFFFEKLMKLLKKVKSILLLAKYLFLCEDFFSKLKNLLRKLRICKKV